MSDFVLIFPFLTTKKEKLEDNRLLPQIYFITDLR